MFKLCSIRLSPLTLCRVRQTALVTFATALCVPTAWAGGIQALDLGSMDVTGQNQGLAGNPTSSTVGTVTNEQIQYRPELRPGELLEVVPGLIVTQHSGDGKANQYFMRGFNLDHGTDLAGYVNDVPVNMPTHAHGQGYLDVNWLIPELVQTMQYRKGPYYAEEGDFASAGAVHVDYYKVLPQSIYSATKGSFDYNRLLAADSQKVGNGHLLYALEYSFYDGPWDLPQGYRKYNGVLRYSTGDDLNGSSFTFMGYSATWNATDQIPQNAIDNGLLSRWGCVDCSDGGKTGRNTYEYQWWRNDAQTSRRLTAYAVHERLNLWSNFLYFLPDTQGGYTNGQNVGNQIEQVDRRDYYGLNGSYSRFDSLFGHDSENTIGFQVRYDNIPMVALIHTQDRMPLETIRQDSVNETRYSAYVSNDTRWLSWLRTVAGVRGDFFDFSVGSDLAANSGDVTEGVAQPKLSMIFGPWYKTEYFVNVGMGIHSNDARGVTTHVDPTTGDAVDPATPVVRSRGIDLGVRTAIIPKVQMALSLWALNLDSELAFSGDGGTVEAGSPSRRVGLEFSTYYRPVSWLIADIDIAETRARYNDNPDGAYIAGAVEGVVSGGVTVDHPVGVFGGLRVRYLGPRPLIEDNSVRAKGFTVVNGQVGYHVNKTWSMAVEGLNLFDTRADDIAYFYTYAFPQGNTEDGVTTHPVEPRQVRFTVTAHL
jgi:hypothetical protein